MLDRFGRSFTASAVAVEGERHALETEPRQALEEGSARTCTAERRYGFDATGPKIMDIKKSLDENDVARPRRLPDDPRETVWRKSAPTCATEVQIASFIRGGVERTRPERLYLPALIAPATTQPSGPARVRKHSRLLDLLIRVAGCAKAIAN